MATKKSHPATAGLSQATGERAIYEVGFHIVPTVGEDGVAAVVEFVRSLLGTAEIINEQFPQKMTLAYTVERSDAGRREKYNEAFFGHIKFALERELVPALSAALTAKKEVLRFLIIETTREDITAAPRRAVFVSDRLEGEVIKKPVVEDAAKVAVSDEDLDKSIDALVA